MNRKDLSDVLVPEIPHLYRYARSLVADRDQAEDLMQDCLLRAVSKSEQFTSGTNLRRWLFTILRNISIDNMRQKTRRGPHVEVSEWQPETHQPPEQEHRVALMDVGRRLGLLRSCDRQIIYLHVFAGVRQDAIASLMGVSVGTVKCRLSRARKTLRGDDDPRRPLRKRAPNRTATPARAGRQRFGTK
ncbi:RNA polymerase sigma factor [Limibaculum sp. M0105]|uniref:RNA polymerase sigma factor n=1 Tax=Thermohalobaculum xanthum TaxID=2753746 RepID=A0A8J7SFI0_9RHOB|nr:RNA polymerase sigma factor [Thermohalobaculum xanthum]MBK0400141.1 RNA polymerase sigma factor [Thermohalobaculum xanthum]